MTLVLALLGAVVFIVVATAWLKLHPILALLIAGFGFGMVAGLPANEVVAALTQGFGATIGGIGLIILFGGVIGVFLERSGAAMRLAVAILGLVGKKRIPLAMGGMGYVVSIPVFCDSGFILLSPLNQALSRKAGIAAATGAIALALGLFASHTLVPPTPGPLAAAGLLGADLGLVMALSLPVALIAALVGVGFAVLATRAMPRGAALDAAAAAPPEDPAASAKPPLLLAIAPIVAPIALIILGSVAVLPGEPLGAGPLVEALKVLGLPVLAIATGALLSLLLPRRLERAMLSSEGWVGQAFQDCAMIILITGAGGAFGKVLQASDLTGAFGAGLARAELGVLAPFLIAAAIKTAQGSSTVAMITTAGLIAPLLPALGLDAGFGPVLATLAVGAGAMAVSHVNDSYFWVVTQLSGLSMRQGLQLMTMGTAVQSLAALGLVLALQAALT